MNSILTTIATSLIVSNVTFILGLKAGKNQSDRQIIKERYKKLYKHFNELEKGLNSTNPKKWNDFKKVKINSNTTESVPTVEEMFLNGDMSELNINFTEQLKKLEEEILEYSYNYNEYFSILKERLLSKLEENCSTIEYSKYEIKTLKDTIGYCYFTEKIGVLILKSQLDDLLSLLNNNDKSGISFELEDNKTLRIFNNTLDDITLSDFLLQCYNENIKDSEVIKLLNDRDRLLKETNKVIKKINQRIKEPFPFWQTFFGAFTDLFKF